MLFPSDVLASATKLVATLAARRMTIATAESCTGGLVAGAITSIPGSSDVFEQGFVTYADEAKTSLIDVPAATLAAHGAVSVEVAIAMADGARVKARAGIALSITGIAGPGGGSAEKPVGLVYIAVSREDGVRDVKRHDFGDLGRDAIRLASVRAALNAAQEFAG